MSGALRFNEGKPSLSYILQFVKPIEAIARIMELGAIKYDDGNWRKGGKPDSEYLNSMMRHLTEWIHGDVYDKDSGCSHLGHAIWNLLALHELNHPDEIVDDELFKDRCTHWKSVKEAGKKAEKVPNTLQSGSVINKDKVGKYMESLKEMNGSESIAAKEIGAKLREEIKREANPYFAPGDPKTEKDKAFEKKFWATIGKCLVATAKDAKLAEAVKGRSAGARVWPYDNEYQTLAAMGCNSESPTIEKMHKVLKAGLIEAADPGELSIPADHCDDSPPLQENVVLATIEPADWQKQVIAESIEDAPHPVFCACDVCMEKPPGQVEFKNSWAMPAIEVFTEAGEKRAEEICGVKLADVSEEVKTKNLLKGAPITVNFVGSGVEFSIKDMPKSESFKELEMKFIWPEMLRQAKTADSEWRNAHGAYFQQLADKHASLCPKCGLEMDIFRGVWYCECGGWAFRAKPVFGKAGI